MWYNKIFLTRHIRSTCYLYMTTVRKCYVDVIDEFTVHLMRDKSKKWESIKSTFQYNNMLSPVITQEHIDEMIYKAICNENAPVVRSLLQHAYENHLKPSYETLDRCAWLSARNGDFKSYDFAVILAKKNCSERFITDGDWEYYEATIKWEKGDGIKALELLRNLYYQKSYLRRKLRGIFRYLLYGVVSDKGEAVLVKAVDTCEELALNFNEWCVISYIWQSCFCSEWFSDQCISTNLLRKHSKLHQQLPYRFRAIIRQATKYNQPETLHRLLELLLEHRSIYEKHIPIVLQILFNYRYSNNDYKSCVEILQWAKECDITMTPLVHKKIIALYLKDDVNTIRNVTNPKFKLKF